MAQHTSAFARPHLVLVALLAALAFAAFAGAPAAHAASCDDDGNPTYPGTFGGYFTDLKVTKVSCATGRRFVKAYYTCRTEKGKGIKGRCTRKVLGYSCKETRGTASLTEFNAVVSCKRGARKISHHYQQNLR
ncbi:MAG TPA: hypothetical protein VMY78_05165 [Solirubrobacteraceae bacterium]|nr:hypothetical protein [Solirubrobacteraceae bacterium]